MIICYVIKQMFDPRVKNQQNHVKLKPIFMLEVYVNYGFIENFDGLINFDFT